jgi:hypothetical protein
MDAATAANVGALDGAADQGFKAIVQNGAGSHVAYPA